MTFQTQLYNHLIYQIIYLFIMNSYLLLT